jgi:hypothetical protein
LSFSHSETIPVTFPKVTKSLAIIRRSSLSNLAL